jgi:hypothetical protein
MTSSGKKTPQVTIKNHGSFKPLSNREPLLESEFPINVASGSRAAPVLALSLQQH